MFVGVGASRVRDLFDQAKRNSPCIVFVDEIDAVGRQRGAGLGGSHDEREQTLNQILVEMDGFDTNTNVIVVAATNRPDVLDPALLRPGRFDRQVILDRPDMRGRTEILKVHTKGKPLDKGVEVEGVARQSPGFSGADLANLVNEAAILAARRNKKVIGMSEFQEALERIVAGPERRSRVISDAEKAIIAYHEGGHAVVQRILPKCDPVAKVTIISRGMALGYTMALPTEDRYLQSKTEFEDKIAGPAWRQRRRAADLRRHHDRLEQRHREGDRPGPPDGHRVRDERQARPALVREARRARVPRPGDRRAAQLQRRGRQDHRRRGPGDHRQGIRAGHRGPDRPSRQAAWPWPRSSSQRRPWTPRSSRRCSATCRQRKSCTGSRPSSGLASRSRSRPPSPPEPWPSTDAALETHLVATREGRYDSFRDFLRLPQHLGACPSTRATSGKTAEWLAGALTRAGVEHAEVSETAGNPVVYADWLHAPGAPTVLVYGHYDVQPVDPLDLWTSPPFEPVDRRRPASWRAARPTTKATSMAT